MPLRLKDTFFNLKSKIVGTKTSDIDTKLNQAVRDINIYKSRSGRNGYIDLVKALVSHTDEMKFDGSNMSPFGATTPAIFGQGSRLHRYRTFEAIIANIPYCYRALTVLVDNILSPDDITKVSLDIKPATYLEDEVPTESSVKHVKEVVEELRLENQLETIVRNVLLYGDYFCEIADAKTALTSRAILAEAAFITDVDNIPEHKDRLVFSEEADDIDMEIIVDYSSLYEEPIIEAKKKDDKKKEKKKKKSSNINNLNLVFHDPKRVVKLQSDMFPLCFGYLIFPKTAINPNLAMQDQAVDNMCASILRSLEKKIPDIKNVDKKELKDIIRTMIEEAGDTKTMNIRYVPPDKIQHFQRPSVKYYPYGESIFDPCQYNAKVIIALETALAIFRLNRSTEKRKIMIEMGLPRDARNRIEELKEELRKRKISLDTFGTVDTIPSMITTFEDIYIPQKDGKPFVDIATFNEGNPDLRGKVDELKFMRDTLVACLGIPSSFLNIEENLSNKAALGEENILFARTIVAHQKYLTHQLNEFIEKIYNIINPEEALSILDNVIIAFPPPKSLQFEREARYLSELSNMVETLERIGVPKEWAKKKYLTSVDWDEIEKYEIDEDIDKNLGTKKDEEGGFGGGGGF